jgi:hypothetical protein
MKNVAKNVTSSGNQPAALKSTKLQEGKMFNFVLVEGTEVVAAQKYCGLGGLKL